MPSPKQSESRARDSHARVVTDDKPIDKATDGTHLTGHNVRPTSESAYLRLCVCAPLIEAGWRTDTKKGRFEGLQKWWLCVPRCQARRALSIAGLRLSKPTVSPHSPPAFCSTSPAAGTNVRIELVNRRPFGRARPHICVSHVISKIDLCQPLNLRNGGHPRVLGMESPHRRAY